MIWSVTTVKDNGVLARKKAAPTVADAAKTGLKGSAGLTWLFPWRVKPEYYPDLSQRSDRQFPSPR